MFAQFHWLVYNLFPLIGQTTYKNFTVTGQDQVGGALGLREPHCKRGVENA